MELSDETHYTIRCLLVLLAFLGLLGVALKGCDMDQKHDAAAPIVETCVKHPATKRVMVQ